jgi:hypothetical protein
VTTTAETKAGTDGGERRAVRRRILLPLVGALLMAATTVVASAGPASAADCSGTLVGHYPVRVNGNGRTIGHVDIYYRSDGWNCARLNSNNLTWGERKHMALDLYTCRETSDPGRECTPVDANNRRYYDYDHDEYRYYAGPVQVYGRGRCIAWDGWMVSPTYGQAWARDAGHCG